MGRELVGVATVATNFKEFLKRFFKENFIKKFLNYRILSFKIDITKL